MKICVLKNSVKHLIAVTVLFIFCSFAVKATGQVVFLQQGGTGDGSSPESPVGSVTQAYTVLGSEGGTIVICGDFELTANFTEPVHTGEVVVTQVYGGTDYRNGAENALSVTAGRRYALSGPTTFKHINFKNINSKSQFILFIANYNPVVMDEGVASIGFSGNTVASSLTVLGGYQDKKDETYPTDLDSHIAIKSGRFVVVGFNRGVSTPAYTGTAHIDISGGEIYNVFGGSASGTGGNIDMHISGGDFIDNIYAGNMGSNKASGTAYVTITGGDFSRCSSITGDIDGGSTIDISKYADVDVLLPLISSFDKIITKEGEREQLKPNDVFEYGSFTDSKGLEIPYRIWFPDNYDPSAKYPLALYMHGNGSRGNDNTSHLTTAGAAYVTKVLNSQYDCIILAPQCNTGTSWVTVYPGSAGYTVNAVPMGGYLSAAKELLDKIVADNAVDPKRIYIFGSSNGGGATWDLLCRFPDYFAAGVPMAGCQDGTDATVIAPLLTDIPIWTFHGDSDATLPVEATRAVVDAIRAAGGTKINYTEMPGGTHNIWPQAAATEGLLDWMFGQENGNAVSLKENEATDRIRVTNPVTDNYVRITMPDDGTVSLLSVSGEVLFAGWVAAGDRAIRLDVPQGIYLLRISVAGKVLTGKLVKSR